jgi:hypothetical protein
LSDYGGYGGNGGNSNRQVQPTFGVSFGLPQPSYGAYPLNPYSPYPIANPYGSSANGLNLGLISVNPLLSVQVTKNDHGEKVIKPFVNLHVTPNENVVHKFSHLLNEKKLYFLNKHEHEHYHHYSPHSDHHPVPIHPPFGHNGPPPPFGHNGHPPHFGPPVYSPQFTHYNPVHGNPHQPFNGPQIFRETAPHSDDYYDDDYENPEHYGNSYQGDFYDPGLERSVNTNTTSKRTNMYANRHGYSRNLNFPSNNPPNNPGASRGGQGIRFPENRKKRDVTVANSKESIEEVIIPQSGTFS